jgi:hypothetical protein
MFMDHHQNAGRHYNLRVANKSFEHVANLKYLVTYYQLNISVMKKFKTKLNSGNAYYHSPNPLLSRLNVKTKIYKNI